MSEKITITIDGKEHDTDKDSSVLDACRDNGYFIPTLCEIESIPDPFGGCRVCIVEIKNDRGCLVTTSCDTPVSEGMEITTENQEIIEGRRAALELLLSEHTGDCVAPCSLECPASLDVQGYLAHIAAGRPREAVKLIKEKSPLALSLGRACFAPCEEECRRELVEDPIAIRQMKQFAAEEDIIDPWTPKIPKETGKSVGVVGGGPSGLTAAYFLRLKGHHVKIYDMMPELGGMMRYGIPNYRLPKDLLDKEIGWILDLGVEAETDIKIGKDISLEEIRDEHNAVFLSTGAWESWMIPIEGVDLPNVYGGIDFLVDHTLGREIDIGDKILVVGCGNTAMDVARTARRMGKDVTIVYRRTEEQAPASKEELKEAKEEGIKFKFLVNPEKICGCREDGVERVECAKMELGEPDSSGRPRPVKIEGETMELEGDTVILAIGQSPETELLEREGLKVENYTLWMDEKFKTNFDGVFTAGDVVLGPSSIVECTGQAREAALAIDAYLSGTYDVYSVPEDYKIPFGYVHTDEKSEEDFLDWNRFSRKKMPVLSPDERVKNFDAIELGFESEEAVEEAERCVECGCLDRFECLLKEYSTLYGVEQETYQGFKYEYEVDDSHPRIIREPGKCILCGSCVRTSEEHSEGVVDFTHRGLKTVVEPAFGEPLGNISSKLIGDLADNCPTGAFEEKIKATKPGPFELEEMGGTYCAGCTLGCPISVWGLDGLPMKLKGVPGPVFNGHICDIGKFDTLPVLDDRPVSPMIKNDQGYVPATIHEVSALLTGKVDILISPSATNEEIDVLKKIADSTGGKLWCHQKVYVHGVGFDDLSSSSHIYVDQEVYQLSPLFKHLVKRVKEKGANTVKNLEKSNFAIVAGRKVEAAHIVAQSGANPCGLAELGVSQEPGDGDSLIVYDTEVPEEHDYDTVVQLVSEGDIISSDSDGLIPLNSWLEKTGTIINAFGERLDIKPVMDPPFSQNIEIIETISEYEDGS